MNVHSRKRMLDHDGYSYSYDGSGYGYSDYSYLYSGYSYSDYSYYDYYSYSSYYYSGDVYSSTYSQSDNYYPSYSNEHTYYGFYGVYSSNNALPSTYSYEFSGNYSAVYEASVKSIFGAAHANVDITDFVFQADEFIAMGAAISEDFAWITNPSCDGQNFVWNNKAGGQ